MGMKSKRKGKTGELELAGELARLFGVECRRSQQFCGSDGDADVVGLPGLHVECKRTESLRLWAAIEQASSDAAADATPMICHRANGKPWVAIIRLDDLPSVAAKLYLTLAASGRQGG